MNKLIAVPHAVLGMNDDQHRSAVALIQNLGESELDAKLLITKNRATITYNTPTERGLTGATVFSVMVIPKGLQADTSINQGHREQFAKASEDCETRKNSGGFWGCFEVHAVSCGFSYDEYLEQMKLRGLEWKPLSEIAYITIRNLVTLSMEQDHESRPDTEVEHEHITENWNIPAHWFNVLNKFDAKSLGPRDRILMETLGFIKDDRVLLHPTQELLALGKCWPHKGPVHIGGLNEYLQQHEQHQIDLPMRVVFP